MTTPVRKWRPIKYSQNRTYKDKETNLIVFEFKPFSFKFNQEVALPEHFNLNSKFIFLEVTFEYFTDRHFELEQNRNL